MKIQLQEEDEIHLEFIKIDGKMRSTHSYKISADVLEDALKYYTENNCEVSLVEQNSGHISDERFNY